MLDQLVLALAVIAAAASAIAVVRLNDMVYASTALAVMGVATAVIAALLGYPLVAVFLVIVYVGAAVMFIIITVSMLGGGGRESRDEWRGLAVAGGLLAASLIAFYGGRLWEAYSRPEGVGLRDVASALISNALPALIVLFVALAATIVEGIVIASSRPRR